MEKTMPMTPVTMMSIGAVFADASTMPPLTHAGAAAADSSGEGAIDLRLCASLRAMTTPARTFGKPHPVHHLRGAAAPKPTKNCPTHFPSPVIVRRDRDLPACAAYAKNLIFG